MDTINFSGFALFYTSYFDKNELLLNLKTMWNMKITPDDVKYEETENSIAFVYDDIKCTIIHKIGKINDDVMIKKANMNYMEQGLAERCKNHSSYTIIAVSGSDNNVKIAMMFTKIASACMKLENAVAVYTTSNVIGRANYINESKYMNNDYLPIENWIYIGLVQKNNKTSAYTLGLQLFDKKELEIIEDTDEIDKVRLRILNIAYYMIDNNIEFTDDETLTINEHDENSNYIPQKYKMKNDKGIYISGKSTKIEKI